jgi:DNA topoisomerase-3
MQVAERLYMAGLISYPRTESSRYPPSFDVESLLRDHAGHRDWGAHAASVLAKAGGGGVRPPHTGKDAGDHPPITPMRACGRADVRAGESDWRLYDHGLGPPEAVKPP